MKNLIKYIKLLHCSPKEIVFKIQLDDICQEILNPYAHKTINQTQFKDIVYNIVSKLFQTAEINGMNNIQAEIIDKVKSSFIVRTKK